tara:strand:- start:1716 stop:2195 length:480 start_codon:yes stop_codon:yes gene_type:complete
MIDKYDINLIKELKEYIREYNVRYFRKEKDWFKIKYLLPTIGFEIKNKEKLTGIDSNYDDDLPIFDKDFISDIELQKRVGIGSHNVLFSVVFQLEHKKIIWRVRQSEDTIFNVETTEEESTGTSLGNRNYKEEEHNEINTVVNYISAQISDTFEKYPPK